MTGPVSASQPVAGNPALERYRQLLLGIAEGKATVNAAELPAIAAAAGRTPKTFATSLAIARERRRLAGVQNRRLADPLMRKSANPLIAKEIDALWHEANQAEKSRQQAELDIARLEGVENKVRRWREEYTELAAGKTFNRSDASSWPDWLRECLDNGAPSITGGSPRLITIAEVDTEAAERLFAKELAKTKEIPRLRENVAAGYRQNGEAWKVIEQLKKRQLDWTEFLF